MASKNDASDPAPAPELVSGPMEIMIFDVGNPTRKRKADPPAALVKTSGLTKFNREATNLLDGLAKSKGLAPEGYNVKLGGNKVTGFVAIYPVALDTTGSVAIGRDKQYKRVTVYLHELFKRPELDGLAPTEDRRCKPVVGSDVRGNACLLIGIKPALENHTKSTGTKQSSAGKPQTA